MQKKLWIIINAFILIVLFLILSSMIWSFSFKEDKIPVEECIDINKNPGFVYDVCYDAYSKNIFLKVKRGFDNYKINTLDVSFFDFIDKNYELPSFPDNGSFKAYKISAEKNPKNISLKLNVVNNYSLSICEKPKKIFVRYCPPRINKSGVKASISPLKNVSFEDFINVSTSVTSDSDVFSLNLVDKERVWGSQCRSNWDCEGWEACSSGVQKRKCKDTNKCSIPINMPTTVKYCGNNCVENWDCEWSSCNNGFSVPSCIDSNNCGTSYDVPKKVSCGVNKKCVVDVKCEEWSNCKIDYNFMDLVGNNIDNLYGIKSRTCVDKNSCIDSKIENEKCSLGIDIYTRQFEKCGEKFIGVYDKLNNNLIARIKEGTEIDPRLNIYFRNKEDNEYCDYCFDGEMNGDEEKIDCGGSCKACSDKYKQVVFKKSLWERFTDWLS